MNIKTQLQQWFTKFLYLKNTIVSNRIFVFIKKHRVLSTVLFTLFAILLITPSIASASSTFDSIIISSTNWLLDIEFFLLEKMTQGVSSLMQNTNVINSDYITIPWKNVRDLANIGFIGVLLIISIMNIIGYQTETYSIQAALPKFIFAVIAVNFSKLMVGFILDAINIFVATLFTFVGGPEMGRYGENIAQMIAVTYGKAGINGAEIMKNAASTNDGAVAQIFLIILLGIMILGFGGLLVTYLVRMVWMWILTVVSPMYFFGMSIGLLNRLQGLWWDKFVMWSLMPLKVAAVMAVGFRIHNVLVQPGAVKAEFMDVIKLGTIQLGNANLQNTPQATVMGYILVAAITWTAFSFAKDQGAADKINDWYTAGIKKVGQGAGWLAYTTRLPGIRRDEEGKLKLVIGGSARARVESVKAVYDHIVKRKAEDRKRQVSEMVIGQYVPLISGFGGKQWAGELQKGAEAARRSQIKQDLEEKHISDDQIPSEMRKYGKASERITVASTAKTIDSTILKTTLEGGIQKEKPKEDIDLFAQTFGTKHPFGAFMRKLSEDLNIKDDADPKKQRATAIMAKMQDPEGMKEVIKLMEGKTDVNIEGLDAHSINDKEMDSYREAMKNSLINMDLTHKDRDKFGYIDKDRKPRRGPNGEMERGEEDLTRARLQYLMENDSPENDKELNKIMSRLTYDERNEMAEKFSKHPQKGKMDTAMNYAMNNNDINPIAKEKNKLEMLNTFTGENANSKILDDEKTRKAFINQGLGKEVLEARKDPSTAPNTAQEILESKAFGNLDDTTKQQVVQTVTLKVDTVGKIDKAGQIKNISTEQLANTDMTNLKELVIKYGTKLKDHLGDLDKDIIKKIAEDKECKDKLKQLGLYKK